MHVYIAPKLVSYTRNITQVCRQMLIADEVRIHKAAIQLEYSNYVEIRKFLGPIGSKLDR